MKRNSLLFILCLFTLSACVLSGSPAPAVPTTVPISVIQTSVAQTLTAMPTSTFIPAAATSEFPTLTSIAPTPTLILPTPTPIPPPSGYVPAVGTPEQFIRYYYSQINLRNYPLTWTLLTTRFQTNVNGAAGYTGYVNFWNTVDHVDVVSVSVASQSGGYAVVVVNATYFYVGGGVVPSNVTFNLTYDYSRSTWLFDSPALAYVPAVPGPSPVSFIYYYYSLINVSDYPDSWMLLSDHFQTNVNGPLTGGYDGYVNYWNTVHRVQVNHVDIVSQYDGYAVVTVYALYIYNNGTITSTAINFHLIYDYYRGTWLFDSAL